MGRINALLRLGYRIRRFWLQGIAYDDFGSHFDGTFDRVPDELDSHRSNA